MANDEEIRFIVARQAESAEPKYFTLKVNAETPVRIGRAPGNDLIVESRGVSQYHAELRYTRLEGQDAPTLNLRDISMNGTGHKTPDGKGPVHLEKKADTVVEDGAQILVPMLLKVSQKQEDRAWLMVTYGGPGKSESSQAAAKSKRKESKSATAQAANGRGAAPVSEEAQEQARLQFVELILKTKEVSAGTTYEDAKRLLGHSPHWRAVDEKTRKECLEIFVEHLSRDQNTKKKDKKKGKEKDKDKSKKKHREEAEGGREDAGREDKKRRDRRGGASRSASGERKRKREKKGSRRSRSRQGRSASPGASPPRDKRRRRDRSGGSP